MDISQLLLAKSDQSNAADLIGAPVTGTVLRVEVKLDAKEQPVSVWLDCLPRGRPWRPCKTAMRLLSEGWGPDTDRWVGRRLRLYHEPEVTFGRMQTGGIRVAAMSHIKRGGLRVALPERRGQYRMWVIEELPGDAPRVDAAPPDLDATMADLDLTRDEVDAYLVSQSKPPIGDLDDAQRVALAGALPKLADKIRAKRVAP